MRKIRRISLMVIVLISFTAASHAQRAALKTNLPYWGTTSPNLQLELGMSKKTTLELGAGFNLFDFSDNKKIKHVLVQPEYRYWFCERFNGHFMGVHAHGAQFNVGGIDIPAGRLDRLKDNRYEGYLYGGGISWGYQWVLSPRWNFEATVGGGYARIHYDRFDCETCGPKQNNGRSNYWGVTKAGLSLIYFIK